MKSFQPVVSFRPARASDARDAARLMQMTMGTLGDYVFGQSGPESTIRFLESIYSRAGHRFSLSFSTLAESEGTVVGLLQAIPGRQLLHVSFELLRATREHHGLRAAFGLVRRVWPLAFEPDATGEEYYIESLAVDPALRNRGIGASLLAEADRQAWKAGYLFCSLGVFFTNEGARRLYERTGYGVERKVFTRLRAPGVDYQGFYRMVKPLANPDV